MDRMLWARWRDEHRGVDVFLASAIFVVTYGLIATERISSGDRRHRWRGRDDLGGGD
jgi:hypothetical protein